MSLLGSLVGGVATGLIGGLKSGGGGGGGGGGIGWVKQVDNRTAAADNARVIGAGSKDVQLVEGDYMLAGEGARITRNDSLTIITESAPAMALAEASLDSAFLYGREALAANVEAVATAAAGNRDVSQAAISLVDDVDMRRSGDYAAGLAFAGETIEFANVRASESENLIREVLAAQRESEGRAYEAIGENLDTSLSFVRDANESEGRALMESAMKWGALIAVGLVAARMMQ